MTFNEAVKIWDERPDKKRNSVELPGVNGVKVRLVKLSMQMFAIQVFNSYAVRILDDNTFILTWTLPISIELRRVFKHFALIELSQEGYEPGGHKLNSPAHINENGVWQLCKLAS